MIIGIASSPFLQQARHLPVSKKKIAKDLSTAEVSWCFLYYIYIKIKIHLDSICLYSFLSDMHTSLA